MAVALQRPPTYRKVLLATDLADDAHGPWAHALKVCATTRADLSVLHVRKQGERSDWSRLPTARQRLVEWGALEYDSAEQNFSRLGFHVYLHSLQHRSPRAGVEECMATLDPDLVIVGTHRPKGIDRLVDGSVGEDLARGAPHAALVVPSRSRPIVSPTRGTVSYPRVLLPVCEWVDAQPAVDAAVALIDGMWNGPADFVLLHVGPTSARPPLALPARANWTWRTEHADGAVVPQILAAADRVDASAIAMVSQGHDSVMDTFMGSRADRVIRRSPCPVLVVPARRPL